MYKFIIRIFVFVHLMLISAATFAQQNTPVEETVMRSNDKIYVVMAVCITILFGLIIYLVSIDRKIGKIEDQQ
ncbi:CcmD family protein [Ferruginibacter sp. SUN002]|uniref:CcmD family protein n=1 Tax=Ferruginibacter sp. SUN002 TaxID=2937789 RepID=UPI003D36B1DA